MKLFFGGLGWVVGTCIAGSVGIKYWQSAGPWIAISVTAGAALLGCAVGVFIGACADE